VTCLPCAGAVRVSEHMPTLLQAAAPCMQRVCSFCLEICTCLQALWYYCQPPLASLQLLAAISSEAAVGKLRGSALLNLLHQRSDAVAGDDQARRMLQKLLHAACTPYFRCYPILHRENLNPMFSPWHSIPEQYKASRCSSGCILR